MAGLIDCGESDAPSVELRHDDDSGGGTVRILGLRWVTVCFFLVGCSRAGYGHRAKGVGRRLGEDGRMREQANTDPSGPLARPVRMTLVF